MHLAAVALLGAAGMALLAPPEASAQTALSGPEPKPLRVSSQAVEPNDYTRGDAWLCRPGRADACSGPLTTTVAPADGASARLVLTAAAEPPIDCFYVYPTVSRDPTPNSDMIVGEEETSAARVQFAAFGQVCRLFAPIYRQTTLATIGSATSGDADLAYSDVRAAWRDYLARDNRGRGVVLIGHSQGSIVLAQLIRDEIEGKTAASLMVSALIPGTVVAVPIGRDVGGTFGQTRLCTSPDQTGCVVAYSTFRADNPPPRQGYFGASPGPRLAAACVNPAALAGGRAAAIGAEMPVTPRVAADLKIDTTFIRLPGLMTAECVTDGPLSYLAVSVGSDRRTASLQLALRAAETRPGWGLHVLDVNLFLDDLVALVGRQSAAWTAAHVP